MLKTTLLAGLAGWPLLCPAQTAPATAGLYVGAGVSWRTSLPFTTYGTAVVGPALTAGTQLTPRLALQLSAGYGLKHATYADAYSTSGGLVTVASESYSHSLALPLLLRATLTNPASRWHLDALAGPSVVFLFAHETYAQTSQGQATQRDTDNSFHAGVSLLLGPGVRYTLTPKLELTANVLGSLAISTSYWQYNSAPVGSLFSSHVLAGLHYHLSQRPAR